MPIDHNRDVSFDTSNPALTLSQVAGIEESEASQFLSAIGLVDYVAMVNAIQNKDVEQITELFDKNEDKLGKMYEALDQNAMIQLQKLSQKLPKVPTGTTTTTGTSGSTPNPAQNPMIHTPDQNQEEIVGADATSGTIAVTDPKQKGKVNIKSVTDRNNIPEIETLMKNAGVNI